MNIPTSAQGTGDNFKNNFYALVAKLFRTKDIDDVVHEQSDKTTLEKCLTVTDLTSLGVGSCVGTGMYLVSGLVAKMYAGPGVIFSFVIAALASVLSGVCYAEFGVRVPHTTGSAYMYSYVTVGEIIAFVIGWNMVLEYLIGTAACACALSACVRSITQGTLNETLHGTFATIFGHSTDLTAFTITLLMMVVLAFGVKKSLIFNNVLNIINFVSWIFLMSAGLFYIRVDNWSNFLPYGWAGVFKGAATCFYAFIGFDIIATTGEEAKNPKRSIPLAIILSLIIILIVYVTSSMMLTLIVPYNEISINSALVAMFGQVGARKCQIVVVIGALAGLTVSMFGSMFPMPRIIYAMSKDGLLFRSLSTICDWTGTPLTATFVSGITAAFGALFLDLQILVEMMSIGTLLAYTLVSTCVLILRYQPNSTNVIEVIADGLKTPIAKNIKGQTNNGLKGDKICSSSSAKDNSCSIPGNDIEQLPEDGQNGVASKRKFFVRRVTRSSPDSDDSVEDGRPIEDISTFADDNRKLVANESEKKHYGTTLHKIMPVPKTVEEKFNENMENMKQQQMQKMTHLCPAFFPWVECGPATEESGRTVLRFVLILDVLIILFDLIMVYGSKPLSTLNMCLVCFLLLAMIILTATISRKPQNKKILLFSTPAVPFTPVIAIAINVYLILNLSFLTLIRFIVWMTLGFIIYFYYGIKCSELEIRAAESKNYENENSVSVNPQKPISVVPVTQAPFEKPKKTVITTRPATLSTNQTGPKSVQRSELFVSPSSFSTWDD